MTESDDVQGSAADDSNLGTNDVSPAAEAEIRELLRSLPNPTMPEDVRQRISTRLAAEPNPYAEQDNVVPLAPRTPPKGRWVAGAAGVAAVGVLGIVVGSAALTENANPPLSAAVVPMNQSGTVYEKGRVGEKVSASLANWRSARTESTAASSQEPSPTPTSPTVTASASPSVQASNTSTANVATDVRQKVSRCIQRIDTRPAMYVDLAQYRPAPQADVEPVAVAVVATDGSTFDVYVLDRDCLGTVGDFLREHVTVVSDTP